MLTDEERRWVFLIWMLAVAAYFYATRSKGNE